MASIVSSLFYFSGIVANERPNYTWITITIKALLKIKESFKYCTLEADDTIHKAHCSIPQFICCRTKELQHAAANPINNTIGFETYMYTIKYSHW